VTGSTCDLLFRDQREKLMETVASVFDGKLNILVRSSSFIFDFDQWRNQKFYRVWAKNL